MPAEVKEVSVWWNGSICSVPSLFSVFFPPPAENCSPPQLLHSASVMMNEGGINRFTSSPLHCCSVQSPCVHGGHDANIFIKCVCVFAVHAHGWACVQMHRQAYKGDNV